MPAHAKSPGRPTGFATHKVLFSIAGGTAVLGALYVISQHNYLLFHSLIEGFSILIAFGIFVLAWNSRRMVENGGFLLFLGLAYLYIGFLDFLHTLAYTGMGVFPGYTTNLPAQLWIAARFMESLSLVAAAFYIGRNLRYGPVLLVYTSLTLFVVASIFYLGIFPDCFVEGVGLTQFKKTSEYVISGILVSAAYLLFRKRENFQKDIFMLVVSSIIITILSELAFTFYIGAYGFSNMVGHLLKLASFYLIYRAIISTGIKEPFELIFRNLNESRESLKKLNEELEDRVAARTAELATSKGQLAKAKERYQRIVEDLPDLICRYKPDTTITFINDSYAKYFGRFVEELLDTSFLELIPPASHDYVRQKIASLSTEKPVVTMEHEVLASGGQVRWQHWRDRAIFDSQGKIREIQSIGRDITELKHAEEQLSKYNRALRTLSACNQALVRAVDENELLWNVCDIVVREGGYRLAWVGYAEEDEKKLVHPVAQAGYEKGYLESLCITWADTERGRVPAGTSIRTGKPAVVRDIMSDPSFSPWREEASKRGYASVVSLPLQSEAKVFGSLNIYASEKDAFDADELKLLAELASDLAYGISTIRMRRRHQIAEESLKESEAYIRTILDTVNAGVLIIEPEGHSIVDVNPMASSMIAAAKENIIGRECFEFICAARKGHCPITDLKQRLENAEQVLLTGDGKEVPILKTVVPVKLKGKEHLLESFVDITKQKMAEEKMELNLQRLQSLRSIDMAITTSVEISVSLKVLMEEIMLHLRPDAVDVFLVNPKLNTLEFAGGRGFISAERGQCALRIGQGYAGTVAYERKPVIVPNIEEAEEEFERNDMISAEGFKAYFGIPLIAKGQMKGVLGVFFRQPMEPEADWLDFLEAIARQAAIAIDNTSMFDELQRSRDEILMAYDKTIEGWSRALDFRDKETEGHSQRVTETTLAIAKKMGVSDEELIHIRRGALLHDIGKLGVPDSILLKPDMLNEEEWEIMRRHPRIAFELLHPIPFLRRALDIPYCHHEQWDGTGYPRGLRNDGIPLAARIFTVVDVWDALSSDRPYRPAWPRQKIVQYSKDLSGKQFDPNVVEVFLDMER